MCSMLSTTPSNQGELLIQQGELAGRRYPYEAIVCQNPTCRCEHVTLKCFLETPEARPPAPVSVCLEMDLERREISNIEELKANPTARALAQAVAAESGQEQWDQLRRIYWELKQYWTEHSDLEQVEVSFPPDVLAGAMVGYYGVFRLPGGWSLLMNRKVGCSTINTAAIRSARARKPCSRSFVFPRKRGGDPPADFVDLLPISRRQSQSARGRKEPSVFRTGFVGIVEKSPCRLRFAVGQAAVTAEAVVWPHLEKADNSFADAKDWSQRPLPLRQWQEVEKMLRSLI